MTFIRGEIWLAQSSVDEDIMAKQTNTIEREREARRIQPTDRNEVRKALMRLRRVDEELPPVDAAAIVREGRALAEDRGAR